MFHTLPVLLSIILYYSYNSMYYGSLTSEYCGVDESLWGYELRALVFSPRRAIINCVGSDKFLKFYFFICLFKINTLALI